jgi:hypothetical protein
LAYCLRIQLSFNFLSKGFVMKKIALIAAAAFAALSMSAQAATETGNFNVNITLTSKCLLTTSAATTDINFAYESFQTGAQPSTGGAFTLQCTNGLTPTSFSLDATNVTDAQTNLQYTLTLPAPVMANGLVQNYTITGSMAANQSGTCATGPATPCTNGTSANKQRTLTITY